MLTGTRFRLSSVGWLKASLYWHVVRIKLIGLYRSGLIGFIVIIIGHRVKSDGHWNKKMGLEFKE